MTWRESARLFTALVGLLCIAAVFVKTLTDRYDVGDAVTRAALNSGLYIERGFIITAIAGVMLAVYVATRFED